MVLYKALEKILGNYFFSGVNAEELEKIPKEGPVIIAANHPKWWDAPILYMSICKIVGRKPKFLVSKNVSNFSECYRSATKHIRKNSSALTRIATPILATIPAILIPYAIKGSGSPLFVSKYRRGGCSREAISEAEKCLRNDGILCVYVQGGTRKEEEGIGHLKKGAAYVAFNLHEENIDIPVYPVLTKGIGRSAVPHKPRIKIKVDNPLYIKDYLVDENRKETLERFTDEIKARMMSLQK